MDGCVNPYNFVRPGEPAKKDKPKGHHKFDGLSGKITCNLELCAPIFVPDPEKRVEIEEGENKGHKILEFFKVNNKPVIPPTEIKGMIRSVAEAASNSCFSVFDGGMLGKRYDPGARIAGKKAYSGTIYAGRIEAIPTPVLDGSIVKMEHIKILKNIAVEHNIWNNIAKNGKPVYVNPSVVDEGKIIDIDDLSETHREDYVVGYLKTSDNFENKEFERVFVETKNPKIFRFRYTIYQNFRIANRNSKHDRTKELKFGDTVWLRAKKNTEGKEEVEEIGFAQIYRKSFEYSLMDKLKKWSKEFEHCSDPKHLCPACKIFGMVDEDGINGGVAGNVSFSIAPLRNNLMNLKPNHLLKILSLPKPTFHPFYLLGGDYNTPSSKLRGRKFYWHHQPWDKTLKSYTTTEKELKSNKQKLGLTSSVELLLPPAEFTFTVEFDNLDDSELGLLLWSLELEEGMAHKLGLGKPLGLGSVKINTKLEIIDRIDRYTKILSTGISDKPTEKQIYINEFKKKLEEENNNNNFDEIPNIRDLKNIMNLQNPLQNNVKYPGDFQWFARQGDIPLPTIEETVNNKKTLQDCRN
jgi:CRISPR-associated protein (TIGR03986 family)